MGYEDPLLDSLEIEVADMVNRPRVKQPKYFGDREASRHRAHERGSYRFARKQSGATLIQLLPLDHFFVRPHQRALS